jgi:hypothetical protein
MTSSDIPPEKRPRFTELPSSGESRYRHAKYRLVIDLYCQRGQFWDSVARARTDWCVTTERRLPPRVPAVGYYAPGCADSPPGVPSGAAAIDWVATLHAIHDAAVPAEARPSDYSHANWELFISAGVLFDPPHDKLIEFADFFSWNATSEGSARYAMHDPPITYMRDAGQAEEAVMDFCDGLIRALWDRYVPSSEIDLEAAPIGQGRREGLPSQR